MGCYVIDINPAALGADSISVTDFRGNVFAMPKKFSNLTPGEYAMIRVTSAKKEMI